MMDETLTNSTQKLSSRGRYHQEECIPPAELLVTDGGEDGEGEEAGLDVVPVVGELLGHQVHPGRGRLAAHLLVLGQGGGHLLHQAQVTITITRDTVTADLLELCDIVLVLVGHGL